MKAVTPVKNWEQCDSCHDQTECPSPFIRSRNSCEDQPCVTGDRFVAGFAHQVTADAGAEVKAFNAYAKWCSDQAQVDGHQQETINASIASTNAAIEKFAGNSRRQHCSHKCRHREICRQGRKCHRGHLFSYKLDRIGGLGVDRSECRERKRWRRTSANLRLNFGTLWILSSARSRLFRVKSPRTLHFLQRCSDTRNLKGRCDS